MVDDDPTFRDVLELRLQKWGYKVRVAQDAREAEELARDWAPDVVLSDVVMPEASGLDLLNRLRRTDPDRTVILLTAHATIEMAVDAMKTGAVDFLTKPLDYQNLRSVIEAALQRRGHAAEEPEPAVERRAPVTEEPTPPAILTEDGLGDFLGRSPAMKAVFALIRSIADSDASVLITGESGTGKEVAAATIHRLSRRRNGPFLPLNTAAIPRDLMESEIFGHEKGAFTGAVSARAGCFELADGGTLFLDEIGEMPKELQPKLLRVLDQARIRRLGGSREFEFDVRTLAATNRDPRAAVEEGILREDLYFRLNVLHVHLPPLRERDGDVPFLARHFAATLSRKHGYGGGEVRDDTIGLLEAYPWPGNVRELRNIMERAVVLARDEIIRPDHLPPYVTNPVRRNSGSYSFPPNATVADVERELILKTLDETGYNKTETARRLGVTPRTIYSKLKVYRLEKK